MFGRSFRSVARALFPRAGVWKLSLLTIVALLAVGCGSSPAPQRTATKVVRGASFRFSAPVGWRVRHTSSSVAAESADGPVTMVSVSESRLEKPYTPSGFAQAAPELDRVAASLARQLGGRVTASRTTTVAGLRVRAYRLTARDANGRRLDDRIAFVLSGTRELQLLCQAPAGSGDPGGACALLFSSLTLST
jgi:hypothetical protein